MEVTLDELPFGTDFERQEAELQSFLNDKKMVEGPKKRADLLKSLPNYEQIMKTKPSYKPSGNGNDFLLFDSGPQAKTSSTVQHGKMDGINSLLNKYIKHTTYKKPPAKESHYTVNILKKEQDSEGITKLVQEEQDYVTVEEDSQVFNNEKEAVPGATYNLLKARLMNKIKEKKGKRLEEMEKMQAMYSEERDLDKEGGEDVEEELLDDNYNFSDEEDQEDDGNEGDGEEDDGEALGDEEEVEEIDGEPVEDEEEDEEVSEDENEVTVIENKGSDDSDDEIPRRGVSKKKFVFVDDEAEESEEDQGGKNEEMEEDIVEDEAEKLANSSFINDESSESEESDAEPKGKPPVLVNKTPQRKPKLQKIESKDFLAGALDESLRIESQYEPEPIPNEVIKLMEKLKATPPKPARSPIQGAPLELEDCTDLCSGHFPTQAPVTPEDSQVHGWSNSGFDDSSGGPPALLSSDFGSEVSKIKIFESSASEFTESQRSEVITPIKMDGNEIETEEDKTVSPMDHKESSNIMYDATPPPNKPTTVRRKRILEFNDEDDEGDVTGLFKANPGLNTSLGFAVHEEDEDEDDEDHQEVQRKDMGLFSKGGGLRKEFIEAEAELSGSEVGSDDEDERGLDDLEEEEGDQEVIDEDELRNQVGRAHLKQVLNDDRREVELLQEMFMEDGDLGDRGKGRERVFRWKGLDNWVGDDGGGLNETDGNDLDYEEENKRLLEKAEKLKWMKENEELFKKDEESRDIDSEEVLMKNSVVWEFGKNANPQPGGSGLRGKGSKATKSKPRSFFSINEMSNSSKPPQISHSEPFDTSTASNKPSFDEMSNSNTNFSQSLFLSPEKKTKFHGSFLARGTPALTRLAEMTKISDSLSNVKNNSRNFVFNVISPPVEAPEGGSNKRKSRVPIRNNKPIKKAKLEIPTKNRKNLNESSQSSLPDMFNLNKS